MKVLKTKRTNVAVCFNGLKNTPPKDFPNIGEMEATANILELFRESIPEYVALLKEGEQMTTDLQSGEMPTEEMLKARNEFSKKAIQQEKKNGEEMIEISFENSDFGTFFQQFERWGKNWFAKLEVYLAFRKDMNETNKQPKGK